MTNAELTKEEKKFISENVRGYVNILFAILFLVIIFMLAAIGIASLIF